MTVLYSNDFDAAADGSLAEWPTAHGAGFQVRANQAVRGAKAFSNSSIYDAAYWSGNTSLGNQCIRFAQLHATGVSVAALLRAQATRNLSYWCTVEDNGAGMLYCSIRVYDFGSVSYDASSPSIPVSVGDVIHFEARAIGSTVEVRAWVGSAARPSTPTLSKTTSYFSTGAVGVMRLGAFAWGAADDVVITDGAGGEDYFYPPPATGFTGGATLGAVVASGSLQSVMSGFTAAATLGAVVAGGTLGPTPGVFVLGPVKVNGAAQAGAALDWVRIYSDAGILLYERTGGTLDGSGSTTLTTTAAPPGTNVRIDWQLSSGRRRMPRVTMG